MGLGRGIRKPEQPLAAMRVLGSLRLGEPRRSRNEACRSCRRRPGVVRPGTSRSSIPKHMTLHRGDLVRVPFIPRTPQGLALESSTVLQVADPGPASAHGCSRNSPGTVGDIPVHTEGQPQLVRWTGNHCVSSPSDADARAAPAMTLKASAPLTRPRHALDPRSPRPRVALAAAEPVSDY